MKKGCCVFLCLLVLASFWVSAAAASLEPSCYASRVQSVGELLQRLQEIRHRYENTYWTPDGTPQSYWANTKYYYGWQCKGFGNYVFNELFKTGNIGPYKEPEMYFISSPNYAQEVARLVNVGSGDTAAVKSFLLKACPGDMVQMLRRKVRKDGKHNAHTLIVAEVNDQAVTFIDCNSDGYAMVKWQTQSWATFASLNMSMTLYHSTVYPADDFAKPVVESAYITNLSTTGYDVICTVSDDSALASVQIGSWNDAMGIGAAVWQETEAWGVRSTVSFHVNSVDLGGQQNTAYYTNVYAFDACGNVSDGVCAGSAVLETVPPEITAAHLENVSTTGYDVIFEAADNTGVAVVQVATWNDAIGVEAAKWLEFPAAQFPMCVHVDIADFGGLQNTVYHSAVYCFDLCSNVSKGVRAGNAFIETTPPDITGWRVLNATPEGFDVEVTATDNGGISEVQIAVWHSGIAIEDAQWRGVKADGSASYTCSFHVDIADFDGAQDVTYRVNAFAFDGCLNVSSGVRVADCYVARLPDLNAYDVLTLPASVLTVEGEAFAGTDAEVILLSRNCRLVEARAFADCPRLKYVIVPKGADVEIAEGALEGSAAKIIYE